MTKRSVNIFLIISLAFNIAFLGGFVYSLINRPFSPHFPEHDMNPRAQAFYMERKDKMRGCFQKFHESKDEFVSYLGSEDYNEKKVMELLEKSVEDQMIMEREMGLSMIEMRKRLSAEEAKEIFGNFRFNMDRMKEHLPGRNRKNMCN